MGNHNQTTLSRHSMFTTARLCQKPAFAFAQNISLARPAFCTVTRTMSSATSFYDFKPKDDKGAVYPLANLKGKVVLVVNTASKCGFTPQLDDLEALYKDVKAAHPNDFEILAFPCNQFNNQDPGTNEEIQNFCVIGHKVTYKVLGKTEVNGNAAEPVWEWMKKEKP